jgi:hypothetical protein
VAHRTARITHRCTAAPLGRRWRLRAHGRDGTVTRSRRQSPCVDRPVG